MAHFGLIPREGVALYAAFKETLAADYESF